MINRILTLRECLLSSWLWFLNCLKDQILNDRLNREFSIFVLLSRLFGQLQTWQCCKRFLWHSIQPANFNYRLDLDLSILFCNGVLNFWCRTTRFITSHNLIFLRQLWFLHIHNVHRRQYPWLWDFRLQIGLQPWHWYQIEELDLRHFCVRTSLLVWIRRLLLLGHESLSSQSTSILDVVLLTNLGTNVDFVLSFTLPRQRCYWEFFKGWNYHTLDACYAGNHDMNVHV